MTSDWIIHNIKPSLKIFRDDLYPFLGGGNKGRKMVEIAKAIEGQKADALVTTGGVQSNHCRAVAVYAAQNHLSCTLVLHGSKEDLYRQSGNAKIMRSSGANLVFVNHPEEIGSKMDQAMADYQNKGKKPYYIQGGGHTPEGGLAYIKAVKELQTYMEETKWKPDYIFLASGTGSTQAGILAGLDRHDIDSTVVGISVGRTRDRAEQVVSETYKDLCTHYDIPFKEKKSIVLDDYLCGGYGQYNPPIKNLSESALKRYGFTLDTCYTAKAFYGMQDYLKANQADQKNSLFWHTGGIFNYLSE